MRCVLAYLLAGLVLLLAYSAVGAEGKTEDYLTKDGKLKESLEVRDLQGGFAGFTGKAWMVETDGSWKAGKIGPRDKFEEEAKGGLSKEQMEALAKALAKHDLLALKETGKVDTNPHMVTIKFGKHTATLNLKAGDPLPKPDPEKPTPESRYSAIVKTVDEMLKKK